MKRNPEEALEYIMTLEAQLKDSETFANEKINLCMRLTEQNNKLLEEQIKKEEALDKINKFLDHAKEQANRADFNQSTRRFWFYKTETIEDILHTLGGEER